MTALRSRISRLLSHSYLPAWLSRCNSWLASASAWARPSIRTLEVALSTALPGVSEVFVDAADGEGNESSPELGRPIGSSAVGFGAGVGDRDTVCGASIGMLHFFQEAAAGSPALPAIL